MLYIFCGETGYVRKNISSIIIIMYATPVGRDSIFRPIYTGVSLCGLFIYNACTYLYVYSCFSTTIYVVSMYRFLIRRWTSFKRLGPAEKINTPTHILWKKKKNICRNGKLLILSDLYTIYYIIYTVSIMAIRRTSL